MLTAVGTKKRQACCNCWACSSGPCWKVCCAVLCCAHLQRLKKLGPGSRQHRQWVGRILVVTLLPASHSGLQPPLRRCCNGQPGGDSVAEQLVPAGKGAALCQVLRREAVLNSRHEHGSINTQAAGCRWLLLCSASAARGMLQGANVADGAGG